jgi:putative DNA methylase
MSETYKRKLVEVALPLDEINAACKADKDRKTGTIRNLHKWFAPAPLPAWRALLFAALVDDPEDEEKRAYLLDVIKRLVANGADLPDDDTLAEARRIIQAQFPDGVPTVMDPFCGGGSTLVEAQRLGLPTFGSDLNPVPVLITRTLTELLPKVYGQQPLHPEMVTETGSRGKGKKAHQTGEDIFGTDENVTYSGYDGLIRDVTYYAELVRERAWEDLKDFYPCLPGETPISWLWARTAICPNPACGIETVLTTSWWLSKKKNELAWIEPQVAGKAVALEVTSGQKAGQPPAPPKAARGASFACLGCGQILTEEYLEEQGESRGLGLRMTCVVAEVGGRRIYRAPLPNEVDSTRVVPYEAWFPEITASDGGTRRRFGLDHQADLYTPRQLHTLTTLADQVALIHNEIIEEGGSVAWADAVSTTLGLALGQMARSSSALCLWRPRPSAHAKAESAFGRNDLPMMWDFAETYWRGDSVGDWCGTVRSVTRAFAYQHPWEGRVEARDARTAKSPRPALVATDPPYFDAIGYADLSDYFYVWHRRALRAVHPDLYPTVASPKSAELTAMPSHHDGDRHAARQYFIEGFTSTFRNLQSSMSPGLPMLVVYASKEQRAGAGEETRWESILSAMLAADLEITGAWPIHMTSVAKMIGVNKNMVAAYIVMVCRPRPSSSSTVSLMEFTRELRRELPSAVLALQEASVLPVDLPQAVLGPGMSIFSRHRGVLDQSGDHISVGRAMQLISTALGEILDEQQGELDPASRFAVAWWESHGWESGPFGTADQLARPQGISVNDVVIAGVAESRGGNVRLAGRGDLDRSWQPSKDAHPTAWEAVHHLVDRLIDGGGVLEAGELLEDLGPLKDQAQMLAYRLESIAARKGWSKDQERYNALIGSWSDMLAAAARRTGSLEGLF